MFRFDSNIDEVIEKLERMQKKAGSLDGQQVSFGELFDPPFMFKYTQFRSIDEMFEAGGFHTETAEDWAQIPEDELDRHVAAHTQFDTWSEMQSTALAEWTRRQLGL